MIVFHPEFIIDENANKKAVIISISEWEQLLEKLEELEDIAAYDIAKAKKDEIIPFDQAVQEINDNCT